jgi:hypothetical protein
LSNAVFFAAFDGEPGAGITLQLDPLFLFSSEESVVGNSNGSAVVAFVESERSYHYRERQTSAYGCLLHGVHVPPGGGMTTRFF